MFSDNTLTFPRPRLWIGILVVFQVLLGILPVVMPLTYLPIVFIPALIAVIGLIFLFIKKQRLSVHLTEVEFAMFLLFLWTAFSIFWTPIQLRGFQQIIKISIGLVIYFISTTMR